MMAKPVLAIDFGGVLSVHDRGAITTNQHKNTSIDMPDAVWALQQLSTKYRLVLLSFCGKSRAMETKQSIDASLPGVFDTLIFVKDKLSKGKVCYAIGASAMIDDTPDVLRQVTKDAPRCQTILFDNNKITWKNLVDTLDLGFVEPQADYNFSSLVYRV